MTELNGINSDTIEAQSPLTFTNASINSLPTPSISQLSHTAIAKSYTQANRYLRLTITLVFVTVLSTVWWLAPLQYFFPISADLKFILVIIIFGIAIWGGLSTLFGSLADKRKFYALREHDISYKSGVIFTKMVSQPILRIQHVELSRGPIDRKIGLAKLQVFSAGGALHTFEIPGLPIDEAQKIRQFILDNKDTNRHG